VSLQALEEAGLISQVNTQMSFQAVSDTASEVRAQMLAERVQALEAELREVRAKAEQASELVGEVRAWRQIAEEAQLRLAEAGQLAIQPISQVDTQMSTQAVSEPSRGFSWRFRRKG
jgi:CheY-specific phosphatase CheX